MRFEFVLLIDSFIIIILLVGLIKFVFQILDSDCFDDNAKTTLFKYFLFTAFTITSFILEYSLFLSGKGMSNDGVYTFFIVNRGIGLVFTLTSVVHSLKQKN